MANKSRLQNFPISWFAVVMGLSGLCIAWYRAEVLLGIPYKISSLLLWLSVSVFVLLLAIYATKLLRYPAQVVAELNHPIKLNFFPTLSIGLLLLSIAFLHQPEKISLVLWGTGTALHLVFTLYVLSVWIHHTRFEIHHMSPAWFIPVVGNILVPIAGVEHASAEISWFFFSIGLLFWLVLLTIIFYRMIFHQPLPGKLMPTLFILIAPPAVGFVSWVQLTGSVDAFARILYYAALFLTLMLATQAGRFARLKFFLSWWAYSFPMAAITLATLLMYKTTQLPFFHLLSWVLLIILTLILLTLIIRTSVAIVRKEICIEEE